MIPTLIFLAATLQILGTLLTGIFTIKGIPTKESYSVGVSGKPLTNLKIEPGYLKFAKTGILMLLFGVFLSALVSFMQL